MDVEIRKAGLADVDLLMEWRMRVLREVFAVPGSQPMKELEQENRRYYETMLLTGGHTACFACFKDEIIGCGGICVYREMPSPDNASGKCAYLMNIYTSPQFRGMGAGEKIVRWLVDQALSEGITKIYLETSAAGKRLYEKTGFAPMADMMLMKSAHKMQKDTHQTGM